MVVMAGSVFAADSALPSDPPRPLVLTMMKFTYGQIAGVAPKVCHAILAHNGQPMDCVEIMPSHYYLADDLGLGGKHAFPDLAGFVTGERRDVEALQMPTGFAEIYWKGYRNTLRAVGDRRPAVLVLCVNPSLYLHHQEAERAAAPGRTVDRLHPLVTAVKAKGIRVLLYVDGSVVGGGGIDDWRVGSGRETRERTVVDDRTDVARLDRIILAARELGVELAPVYRAYAILRAEYPEVPMQEFLRKTAHGSGVLSYLNACVLATALLGRRCEPIPADQAQEIVGIAFEANRREFAGQSITNSPPALTAAMVAALHEAANKAVAGVTMEIKGN